MQDNINTIIANALRVNKSNITDNIKAITTDVKVAISDNKDAIKAATEIDIKNNNGFEIDFDVISNIFYNLLKEETMYGNITLSQKDDNKNIVYGKQIMDKGNVVVITDGNPYVTIEMAIRNLIAGNTTIISNNGYMFGTNTLLVQIIQSVLEQLNIDKNMIQLYASEKYTELLNNYANIDLVICVGNHELQTDILNKSKNEIIISGYEYFDLYIEDKNHLDFLTVVLNNGLNINVYINKELQIDYPNAILVEDLDEAIAQINYNGNKYSAAIFTDSTDNASKFIKEVKSKIVTFNTSPTVERIIDIKQEDLVNEKTIIYPSNYKLD